MLDFIQTFRQALRGLLKNPGYTVVAVVTLALAIGATTAIYTVVQSVLLEPLPYPEPDRLVVIQEKNPEAGLPSFSISPLNFRDYRAMSTSFEVMAAQTGSSLALGSEDGPARRLDGRRVTADYLRVFGITPGIGRDFTAEDDLPGAAPTIVLSHAVWESLGGSRDLVGSDLRIDGEPTTVVGILPDGVLPGTEALLPLRLDFEETGRGSHWLIALGRLRGGVSVEQGRTELEKVAAQLEESYPDSNTGWSALVSPLQERIVGDVEQALWILLGAVCLVLLIACANVANLTLARHATREREVALRTALGAGRLRLVGRMLAESVVLSLTAGALGVALAYWGTAWLAASEMVDLPRSEEIAVDGGVLLFALVASLGAAFLFGFVPAWQASRPDLASSLKEGGRGSAGAARGLRLRSALVLVEVALALLVLVGAGLLLRSFEKLLGVDPGFDPRGVWTATLSLPNSGYEDEAARKVFFERLVEEMSAIPGVEGAATIFPMPLSGGNWVNVAYLEGEPIPPPNQEHNVNVRFASPGYFGVLRIPLLRGRDFDSRDREGGEPVVVVNSSAVDAFWSGQDPVGKRLSFGRPDDDEVRWYRVIGVAGDVHHQALDSTTEPAVYRSILQDAPDYTSVVLRTPGDPGSLAAPLRDKVAALDRNLPLFRERTVESLVASSLSENRFNATLLGLFAGLALLLASIGVFGVVSYGVLQRRREIGVRLALGARSRQILALVFTAGMRPVLLGIVVGLGGALAATRILASLVYGVQPNDPWTFAAVGALLVAVAAVACLEPALRATRVDPMETLRRE